MKICTNCGNKLTDEEKRCSVCKTKSKDFPMVADSDTEKQAEIIEAVRTRNMSKKDVTVKKKNKGCLTVIILFLLLGFIGFMVNSCDDTEKANAPVNKGAPVVVTVDQLVAALKDNALQASKTYTGAYVEVTGKLSNIDSSGDYFSITELNNEYSFDSIMCYTTEEHLDAVSKLTKGQKVTVVGTIKSVGEVMGYSLDVESIK
ncbi:MAG TPA: hypothetical protein VN441_16235 [Syntrophomonas sp.]|nr:hypothetical protein [Syntrophomonas sp.]